MPHVYVEFATRAATPVLLTSDAAIAPASDVLLTSMTTRRPEFGAFFARYERVIEVVSRLDDDRHRARARFKVLS